MGAMDLPSPSSLSAYSAWLKIEGLVYMTVFFVVYYVKIGLAWHDAGEPFVISDIKFHPYWNMITIPWYGVLGLCLFCASYAPAKSKLLLSWAMWGANFTHGVVALSAVFNGVDDSVVGKKGVLLVPATAPHYVGPSILGDIPASMYGLYQYDKLFVAVPLWFTLFAINLYFAKSVFGSALLPWDLIPSVSKPLGAYSTWLKIEGLVYMGVFFVVYYVKIGLAWHNAGQPFAISDIKFHPYWNMITIPWYGVLGLCLFCASYDPAADKLLLSYTMWGANFMHGVVATSAVFHAPATVAPHYVGPSVLGDIPASMYGLYQYDKLFAAVPLWFTLFAINLYFAKAFFGSYLLPWTVSSDKAKVSPPTSDRSDTPLVGGPKGRN